VSCLHLEAELQAWGDPAALRDLVRGIDLHALLQAQPDDAAQNLSELACAAAALAITDPQDERIVELVSRACRLLSDVQADSTRLCAASKLLICTPWLPMGVPIALVREYDALCRAHHIPPLECIEWCCASAWWQLEWGGQIDAAQATVDFGMEIAEALALPHVRFHLDLLQARLHVVRGRHLDAIDLMAQMNGRLDARDQRSKAQIAAIKALVIGVAGDTDSASELAHELFDGPHAFGGRPLDRCRFAQAIAAVCAGAGAVEQARRWTAQAQACAYAGEGEGARLAHELIEAALAFAQGESPIGDAACARALAAHRGRQLPGLFVNAPQLAGLVAELALEANLEPAYIQEVIRAQHLGPAGSACAAWPRPVKVWVLGALGVTVDGEPVCVAGRAHRLFELLCILAAAGPAGWSQQALERQLWAESDEPKTALRVALHRLRKLLGGDAIITNGGVLSLSREHVWTDVDALANLCVNVDELPADAPASLTKRLASRLLSLYKGGLQLEDNDPWLLMCDSRLRADFVAAAGSLASRLEGFGAWREAVDLYRRMLEAEPLCEIAYRGLMRATQAQGDTAAASTHFRSCRDTLSIVLNRAPSRETDDLARSLGVFEPSQRSRVEAPAARILPTNTARSTACRGRRAPGGASYFESTARSSSSLLIDERPRMPLRLASS
jgi:DNA-binding SARP family transcriptional activator